MDQELESSKSMAATGNRRRWILRASALLFFAILGFACGAVIRCKSPPPVAVTSDESYGPEWGRRIPAVQLKNPTFQQAIDTLGRLSGAKIIVDWPAMPGEVTPQTIVPVDVDVHGVSLGEILPWLVVKAWKKDRFEANEVVCRAREGKIYISEDDRGIAVAPQAREFDVRPILRDIAEFRKSHPAFPIDPANFDVSPQQLLYAPQASAPQSASPPPATQPVVDLTAFLRAATDPWSWPEGQEEMRVVDEKLIVVKQPQLVDQISDLLAHLRDDGDIEAQRESSSPPRASSRINLDQVLAKVNIPLTSLPGAIKQLEQLSGANIFIKRELVDRLPADGFGLKAQNITLRDALVRLLKGTNLGFMIVDGMIRIEDRYRTEYPDFVTRYYAVADLLARPPTIPATLPVSEGWDNDPQMAVQQGLIKQIYFAVPDEHWAFGPLFASGTNMRIIGDVLVVRQSVVVQERIKSVLAEFRRSK